MNSTASTVKLMAIAHRNVGQIAAKTVESPNLFASQSPKLGPITMTISATRKRPPLTPANPPESNRVFQYGRVSSAS